jgi:hypothetical protein
MIPFVCVLCLMTTPAGTGEEPKKVESKKSLTFDEALARVKKEGQTLHKEFKEELPAKRKLLTDDELETLDKILALKADADNTAAAGARFMYKHKMDKWVLANAIGFSASDKSFLAVAKLVWDRSPKQRGAGAILELAVKWGEKDGLIRDALATIIKRIEAGKEFTAEERDLVLGFAGEEYLANRP